MKKATRSKETLTKKSMKQSKPFQLAPLPKVDANEEKKLRGRPPEHIESMSKITVTISDNQIYWLDQLASTIRFKTKSAISRTEIIRAIISAVKEGPIDLSQSKSENEIKERLLEQHFQVSEPIKVLPTKLIPKPSEFVITPEIGIEIAARIDENGLVYFCLDKKFTLLATTFLRALGYSTNADIISEFFKIRKVDVQSAEGKLLAEDVLNQIGDSILGNTGERVSTTMIKSLHTTGLKKIKIAEDADANNPIIKMLLQDPFDSYESALKYLARLFVQDYNKLSEARKTIMMLFFNEETFNLGNAARCNLNEKLGLTLDFMTLTKEDVIGIIKYLIENKK